MSELKDRNADLTVKQLSEHSSEYLARALHDSRYLNDAFDKRIAELGQQVASLEGELDVANKESEEYLRRMTESEAELNQCLDCCKWVGELEGERDRLQEASQDAEHFLTQVDPVHWPSRKEASAVIATLRQALEGVKNEQL